MAERAGLALVDERGAARSVDEHLTTILEAVEPLAPVERPLMEALDLVCAEAVVSAMRLPRFDNSAMDGYAVHAADVAAATADAAVSLPVIGEIGAGQPGPSSLPPGTAAKIMTGAPLPSGADAVVPYEWTDHGAQTVWINQAAELGAHVRAAGEDVREGDLLIRSGTLLGPRHLGLLASVGRPTVQVRPRPRVVIISTGTELREPGTELAADSIYDGNSYLLAAAVLRAGGVPERMGIMRDDPDAFLASLTDVVARADAVVTSGGISMGDFDIVKAALRRLDPALGSVWFGGVAMQPGKPQGFGSLRTGPPTEAPGGTTGERRVPIFTLPGNPVSSYLSFELFVRPALRTMLGVSPVSRALVEATLTRDVRSPAGRRQLLRGGLTSGPLGLEIAPVGGPGSHLLRDLATADSVIVVPEDVTEVAAGSTVQVMRLDSDE